jgi:hypothetical protein
MPHLRHAVGAALQPLFDHTVRLHKALVLAQVFRPGTHEEGFEVAIFSFQVSKTPQRDTVAPANASGGQDRFRRSTMSPIAPVGSASTKNGSAAAVCMGATYIGPALSDTINQAAPTACMNVPTSESISAIQQIAESGCLQGPPDTGRLVIRGDWHRLPVGLVR